MKNPTTSRGLHVLSEGGGELLAQRKESHIELCMK